MYRALPDLFFSLFALLSPIVSRAQESISAPEEYAAAVQALQSFIEREATEKRLPAVSIALVDGQRVVWARGFGFAAPQTKVPATAETVYRVGSVSKLFTDIAVMQLVEQGKIDLDAPIEKYLPDFKPANPFKKPITLRQMMSHRSGLVREPPVGHYLDPSEPTVAKTVESLNGTALVYEPGSKIKYSNAAIATVGHTLEKVAGTPYDQWVREKVLLPLGMKRSSFTPTPEVNKQLAKAVMWTYHGREFPAPTFELGEAPAGCMYSTVNDLARFMTVIFNDGGGILKPETLKEMLTPQFAKKDETVGYGLGFSLSQLDGKKRAGHGGAIYGFATDLAFLPEEKLGVVVVASRDVANPTVTRIADTALRHMLAVKEKKPLPKLDAPTAPLDARLARELLGSYAAHNGVIDLVPGVGGLRFWPEQGGFLLDVRTEGGELLTDGVLGGGTRFKRSRYTLQSEKQTFREIVFRTSHANGSPDEPSPHLLGLIGEYGWDHNVLYIFEKRGQLHALIEWFFEYPLTEETPDVYRFPTEFGLYHGEKLIFRRDKKGRATEVEVASMLLKRRVLDGEGKTFRIEPLKPVAELRKDAMTATPPTEKGPFREPELVELTSLDPTIKLDLRYATDNNFLSTPLYPATAKAYMQRPAAEAVVRVHKALANQGYGLLIHDPYRPWYVTKMFWDATPVRFRNFVADPTKGSRHNRGCAVDLTLYDLKTGKPIEMVGGYDEFSDRSYPDYIGGTSRQRWHRDLLRRSMEAEGFTVYEAEWWHFDYKDWRVYGIMNKSFEELAQKK